MTPQEYIQIKTEFGKNTRLGEGAGTCFGSLIWCCKPSKPCPLRDMTLKNMGMTHDEYLDLKKELSEKLTGIQKPEPDARAEALANIFDISKLEAMNILTECNNDLSKAVRVIQAKFLENPDYNELDSSLFEYYWIKSVYFRYW